MCYQEISHYRCGHTKENEVRKCRKYREKKTETGTLLHQFMKPFSRNPRHCGDLQNVNQDIESICSPACAQWQENMRKRQLMRSHERARATAREYRRRKEEEERKEKKRKEEEDKKKAKKRFGKSRLPVLKGSVLRKFWETARGGITGYLGTSAQSVAKQPQQTRPTRVEAQRAPPARLADRRIPPQPNRPQNPPTPASSRTQANIGPRGRQAQVAQSQTRAPSAPRTNRPSPSSRRQPECNTTENLNEILGRFEANQFPSQARTERRQHPTQPVTARRQVTVNPPTSIPQPSQARISHGSQGPPVPPKDPWRPQHPQLAPAPLTPRSKESGARFTALRSARQAAPQRSEIPIGYRPEQQPPARAPPHPTRTVPQRKPVGSGVSVPPPRAQQSRPQPGTTTAAPVPECRPNPVFANRQGRRPAGMSAVASSSSAAARQPSSSSRSRPQPRTNTATTTRTDARSRRPTATSATAAIRSRSTTTTAAPPKPKKKRSWLKKLVGPPSSSESSVEWVSQDAARIERGSSSR